MELSSKLLEQIAFNTRPKIEEHMLIIMDNFIHGEHLSQPLQTNNKQFKIPISFLSAYNGVFKVTNRKNNIYFENFKKAFIDEDFIQIRIPEGAYEIKLLDNEIKRIIIDREHYTQAKYPYKINQTFQHLDLL